MPSRFFSQDEANSIILFYRFSLEGVQHWHKNQTRTSIHYYWRPPYQQADPIDIETSAYALLVHAANKDYVAGMPILKWLTRQRNAIGGFASTQVTEEVLFTLYIDTENCRLLCLKACNSACTYVSVWSLFLCLKISMQ